MVATRLCASRSRYVPPDEHDTLLELFDRFLAALFSGLQHAALRAVDQLQPCQGLAVACSWPASITTPTLKALTEVSRPDAVVWSTSVKRAAIIRDVATLRIQPVSTLHADPELSRMSRASRIRREDGDCSPAFSVSVSYSMHSVRAGCGLCRCAESHCRSEEQQRFRAGSAQRW